MQRYTKSYIIYVVTNIKTDKIKWPSGLFSIMIRPGDKVAFV
jgi:hypothetical protein